MAFCHLHNHTEYSIQDSVNKIRSCIGRVKELGMTACAITDHGVMYGCVRFYKEAMAQGIKPILGCEVYVAPGSRFEKDGKNKYHHLVLLAENNKGYENLMALCSEGFMEGFYYKPRIDHELIEKYHEGIIALSACLAGEIPSSIVSGGYEEAKETALYYESVFGKGNFFLELQNHGIRAEGVVCQELVRMSGETGIPLVATNDNHYTNREDASAHDLLLCIRDGKQVNDPNRERYDGSGYHIRSEDEMKELFPNIPEAIENTQKIADRCNVEIEFHKTKMPHYDVPEGYDAWTYLNKLCMDGLKRRYPDDDGALKKQLDYELSVIKKMGYVEYFLIVWDFINWAREHRIPVGPGRGSAAGSLVSYTTGITDIDPVKYSLLFERFLNPERVSMPDIDIDFCMDRRREVIGYVTEKYGKDCVVQIITFGTMAARQVIKDVGKVMGMSFKETNEIAKKIPQEPDITIRKALERNREFADLYHSSAEIKELTDMAMKLEGLPRQTGTHAAGVIICDKPVTNYVPVAKGTDGFVSQYTMTEVEELGLLKMDFLGLRTLTAIEYARQNIQNVHGIDVDMDKIDYDDKNVFDYISTGETDGVFQFESEGIQKFVRELKPENMEDLIAGISLYRPGPMDFIPAYIAGKSDPDNVRYDCPEMEPILKPTYGCIVYQEQVMQIVRDLAGYTLGQSDLVRRAMSKKKADVMEKERKNFVYGNKEKKIPGCVARGIPEKTANRIYDEMTDFAKYAFNKSHAAAYAVISYQTAWLKYYYPAEYMAALMSTVTDKRESVVTYVKAAEKMGINMLPADINKSSVYFGVDDNRLVFALSAITQVSVNTAQVIVKCRSGGFSSFWDALGRLQDAGLSQSAIGYLIKAGAFDCFGGKRSQYLAVYEKELDFMKKKKKKMTTGQLGFFDFIETAYELPDMDELPKERMLEYEKEACGMYLTGSPLMEYDSFMEANGCVKLCSLESDGKLRKICAIAANVRETFAKKSGKKMAFITVTDGTGEADIVVFPDEYQKNGGIVEGDVILAAVRPDEENNSFICEDIRKTSGVPMDVWVRVTGMDQYAGHADWMEQFLQSSERGRDQLVVYAQTERAVKACNGLRVSTESNLNKLRERFGKDNVVIRSAR